MKVKELIKRLKKMPPSEEVGISCGDYDKGDSDPINSVEYIGGDEPENDSGVMSHGVEIRG